MESVIVKVASALNAKAFVPFTVLPAEYAGKMVEIRIITESDIASMQLAEMDALDELPWDETTDNVQTDDEQMILL